MVVRRTAKNRVRSDPERCTARRALVVEQCSCDQFPDHTGPNRYRTTCTERPERRWPFPDFLVDANPALDSYGPAGVKNQNVCGRGKRLGGVRNEAQRLLWVRRAVWDSR